MVVFIGCFFTSRFGFVIVVPVAVLDDLIWYLVLVLGTAYGRLLNCVVCLVVVEFTWVVGW